MGLMNTHQLLKGARTRGGIRTYVLAGLLSAPTVTVDGTVATQVNISGGAIEFDGRDFSTAGTLNFAPLSSYLFDQHTYLLCAVPKYNEYVDRAAAETAGANYYVSEAGMGESLLHYFLPSAVESAVRAAGGPIALRKKRSMGTATAAEITVLNMYDSEVEKLTDPRFTGRLLDFVGVEYILADVYAQDNRSKKDALVGMSNDQLRYFLSTQGEVLAERKVSTLAAANTAYAAKIAKVKRAFGYTSLSNATNNVGGQELRAVDANAATAFTAPVKVDGSAVTGTITHVAVYEYYYPSFMPEGHEGMELGKYEYITKEQAAVLGRINPIYMENAMQVQRTMIGSGPKPAVTLYADPQPLAKVLVTKSGANVTALSIAGYEAEDLIGNTTL